MPFSIQNLSPTTQSCTTINKGPQPKRDRGNEDSLKVLSSQKINTAKQWSTVVVFFRQELSSVCCVASTAQSANVLVLSRVWGGAPVYFTCNHKYWRKMKFKRFFFFFILRFTFGFLRTPRPSGSRGKPCICFHYYKVTITNFDWFQKHIEKGCLCQQAIKNRLSINPCSRSDV